ncbi:MAG: hypothetical protein PVJ57_00425 [Phycisphaerae bacterium]|jgi:hypothetical protein
MSANPLFWVHFRLTGAWRNNVAIAIAYGVLVLLGSAMLYQLGSASDAGGISSACLGFVTLLQGLFLLLIAPSGIRKAVLRDYQTGMIESHRLSPMSGVKIVAGYLTGPPVQSFWLFGMGLLLGAFFVARVASGMNMPRLGSMLFIGWYSLQACLICTAFMVGSLALLLALGSAGKTNIVGVAIIVGIFGGYFAVAFVPGLALISGVIGGGTLVRALFGGGVPTAMPGNAAEIAMTIAGQVAFGLVFAWAACRKVRAPERPMFGVGLGLLLAALWSATAVAGMNALSARHWLIVNYDLDNLAAVQLVMSTSICLIVALFPLVGAAAEQFRRDRGAAFGEPAGGLLDGTQRLIPVVLALLVVLTLAAMYERMDPALVLRDVTSRGRPVLELAFGRWDLRLAMLLALLASFWVDYNVVYFAVARGMKLFRWLLLSLLVFKVLPLVLDLVLAFSIEHSGEECKFVDLWFAGYSPIGTLVLCMAEDGKPWPGLIGQGVIALGATWLGWRARRALFVAARRGRAEAA